MAILVPKIVNFYNFIMEFSLIIIANLNRSLLFCQRKCFVNFYLIFPEMPYVGNLVGAWSSLYRIGLCP